MQKTERLKLFFIGAACLYLILYWHRLTLFGQVPFDGDVLWLFYPNFVIGKKLLQQGFYLLWDPYRNMGEPLLAAPHDEVLYPVRLLIYFMDYVDYQRIYVVFHTLLAAGFGYLLGKELLKTRVQGLLMALGLGFNGFVFWRALYSTNFCSMTWLPAIYYFFIMNRPVAMGVCVTLQWLAGYPPFAILTSASLVVLALVSKKRRERLICVAKGGAVAAGLSAVQLLPFIEMLRESVRPLFFGPKGAMVDSLHPLDLANHLVLPSFLIQPIQNSNEGLSSFFLGPLFLILFVWGFIKGRRRERLAAALTVAAFIMTMGSYTNFYSLVPLINIFRYPVNWLILALPGLIFVGAFGLGKIKFKQLQWVLVALIAVDLWAYAAKGHYGWARLDFVTDAPVRLIGLDHVTEGRRVFHTDIVRESYHNWGQNLRDDFVLAKGVMMPSYAAATGYKEAASRHSLMSKRASNYAYRLSHSPPDSPLFDYAGIEKIVAPTPEGAHKPAPSWKDLGVITNPDPKPRAFTLEGGEVRVIHDKPGNILVEAEGPATVVVSESFYPGWKVKIDNQPAALESFEEMFLSAKVGAGQHQLKFVYRPLSFILGLIITLLTGLATIIAIRKSLL